jgi:hypothetical protein
MYADVLGDMSRSRAGICRDRPRAGKPGRRGVTGLSFMALSSFDFLFCGSRNFGDGDSAGGALSESDRALEGDLEDIPFLSGVPATSGLMLVD